MKTFRILVLSLLLIPAVTILAQNKNSLFLELGGNAVIYSLNYDHLLGDHFSIRGGISYLEGSFLLSDFSYVLFPLSVNFLAGQENSKFELGMGVLAASGESNIAGLNKDKSGAIPFVNTGYRYQPVAGGFFFRIGVTAFVGDGLIPWPGISLGTTF